MKKYMHKRGLTYIALFLLALILSHMAAVKHAPEMIMNKAMAAMAKGNIPRHKFSPSPRITPKTQRIVRPSPDLAYNICPFDLTQGPVMIKGAKWDGYGSLTVFNAETDVVFIAKLDNKKDDNGAVILALEGQNQAVNADNSNSQLPIIKMRKPKGIALIRRLAPTQELYDQARALSSGDICRPLGQ